MTSKKSTVTLSPESSSYSKVKPQAGLEGTARAGAANDYATQAVPDEERRSFWNLCLEMTGFCICMGGLFTGSAIAQGANFQETLIATLAGNSILALYGGLIAAAGASLGVSTTMLSRHAFGRTGAMIVSAVLAITILGWYSVQTGFFGQTIHALWPYGGIMTSVQGAALWGGLLMMTTAYWGYQGLSTLSKIAVPLLLVLTLWAIFQMLGVHDLELHKTSEHFSLGKGITLTVGAFAVGAVVQADIARYARNVKESWLTTIFGYVVANTYVIIAGALTFFHTGEGDLPKAMLSMGLGVPALLVLIAAQWTTNDNNLYSASLGIANIFKVKKSRVVLVTGVLATLIGVWGLAERFTPWLMTLGILAPPIAGVIIADYWLLRRKAYCFGPGVKYAQINLAAFIAWVAGIAAGAWLDWGIPALNSIIVALLCYVILFRVSKQKQAVHSLGTAIEDHTGF